MPKLPVQLLGGLGDVLRRARVKPRISTSEWIGRGPGEDAISALADKLNKVVPQAAPVEFVPTPEQMKLALNAELSDMNRYLAAADKWDPADPEGRARHVSFLQGRINELLAHKNSDPSKYPPPVKRIIAPQYNLMPETRELYRQAGTPSTPAEQAIKTYRQNPAAFQELSRKGKLSKALVDALKEDALLGGDYAKDVADATQKEALLSKLVDQPLALKRKLALFRGLDLPSSMEGSGLFGSGYGSFSYDPNVALGFVGNVTPSRTGILTRMKPKGQEGLRGLDISDDRFSPSGGAFNDVENELEVLLAPRQGFRIVEPRLSTNDELLLDVAHDPAQVGGMTYYADGGKVKPTYNTQNPMTHYKSTSQDRPLGAGWGDVKKGTKSWAPDVAGFFLGDIPDAIAYALRRAKNVQGEQSIPSLGAGAAVRRAVHDLQAELGLEDKFVPPTGQSVGPIYEPSAREEVAQFANPLAFVNPTSVARGAGRGGAEVIARAMQSEGPLARMATAGFRPMNVVKNKGGNWLTGSVEDALRRLKQKGPYDDFAALRASEEASNPELAASSMRRSATNSWIDKALTKYVKNQMATPEDPIRALAEQGVLHMTPNVPPGTSSLLVGRRAAIGQKPFGEGTAPLARTWEDLADEAVMSDTAAYHLSRPQASQNPWLERLAPNTPVYRPNTNTDNLGFNHLIDELGNAINPESGLPRHLQFPADRLDKVSVPQAVQRVSDINKWRAEQKAIADQARANNAATVLHKEYPEKGMRWVELRKPELDVSTLPDWQRDMISKNAAAGIDDSLGREAIPSQALADALKYEGDVMGHCVGGYCDDVASGRSQIFSLRDEKGQPHVTIETAPVNAYGSVDRLWNAMSESDKARFPGGIDEVLSLPLPSGVEARLGKKVSDILPKSIVQIKGKQNRAPNPEYLPFVQDFVKSGQWSDVGDLQNAGLMKNKFDVGTLKRYGKEYQPYVSQEELDDIMSAIDAAGKSQTFAHGGPVTSQSKIETVGQLRAIIASLSKDPTHA